MMVRGMSLASGTSRILPGTLYFRTILGHPVDRVDGIDPHLGRGEVGHERPVVGDQAESVHAGDAPARVDPELLARLEEDLPASVSLPTNTGTGVRALLQTSKPR